MSFKVTGPTLETDDMGERYRFDVIPDSLFYDFESMALIYIWLDEEWISYSEGFGNSFSVFNETDATKVKLRFG